MLNCAKLLMILALALLPGLLAGKKYNITVGYLTCIKGDARTRQGISISGALTLALEEINNSKELLPDVSLNLAWNDTRCETEIATRIIRHMSSSGVVAFFGPEGPCEKEAIIAHSWNLPMISYKCYDDQPSSLPNFARLNPPETQATKYIISLLRYYRWNKFSILYEESWSTVALNLKSLAKKNNMTVNHQLSVEGGMWYRHIQNTKLWTRIYVFLGTKSGLLEMMTAMESQQLFETGEYMVIFVDMVPRHSMEYLTNPEDRGSMDVCPDTEKFRKRARSLLVIASAELKSSSYESFIQNVRQHNSREPFKFPLTRSIFGDRYVQFVSIYAAYLYDSVKLYAMALHSLIEEDTKQRNETLTYERLMSIATNGSRIVSKMIAITPFKSITGMHTRLDERADSVGEFSVLAFKPFILKDADINCSYSMIPVSHFQEGTKEFPVYSINPRLTLDWPDNVKPDDEPSCGFPSKNCPKKHSHVNYVVVCAIIVILFALCFLFKTWGCKKSRALLH